VTKQELYERRVALKIAEMVTRDGVTAGVRDAYAEYSAAIEAMSPEAQRFWYESVYLPNKLQDEINGTKEEQHAMTALLTEVKSKGGK
jgi:hypothetical protein